MANNNTGPRYPTGGPQAAMVGSNSGGAASNTNPVPPWMNMNVNVNAMAQVQQQQRQQQRHQPQDVFTQQQMANLVNSSINPMALTAQQNHQKLQMMQLHQRMEQQRGRGGVLQNAHALRHSLQQQHRSPPPLPNNLIQHNSSQQMMQYQMQQQQMTQLQMAQQQQQPQMMQQQLLNQVMQQQSQNQMMQQQTQQMQALEEQKRQYSIMLQKNLRTQEQSNGPVSASGHHPLQQHQVDQKPPQIYPNIEINGQVDGSSSLDVGSRASSSPTSIPQGLSPRPNSQFSTISSQSMNSSHDSSAEFSFPYNTFYRPLSTSAKNKRQISLLDRSNTTTTELVQSNANDADAGACSRASMPKNIESNDSLPLSSQRQESSACKAVGKKAPPQRRQSQTQPASPLKYEEVAGLINECTIEQQVVWVAGQVGSAGGCGGFQKATSALQRIKRQRARACKQKEEVGLSKDVAEEKLKLETFDTRVAKRMYAEMKQGIQYCNLITGVVRKILEEIDPGNPILLVKPPAIGFDDSSRVAESEIPVVPSTVVRGATSVYSACRDKRLK